MGRGAYETPSEPCPYCGTDCEAEFCDIGVGMVQCGPYHCESCDASSIGTYDEPRELSDKEKDTGWYAPHSEAGSSANVIGGKIVSTHEMKEAYADEFTGNPNYHTEGVVKQWLEDIRKTPGISGIKGTTVKPHDTVQVLDGLYRHQ